MFWSSQCDMVTSKNIICNYRSVFSASQGTATESIMGDDIADHTPDVSSQWAGKHLVKFVYK